MKGGENIMNNERLKEIEEKTNASLSFAEEILDGDSEGYDGADGAREVMDLCNIIRELTSEIRKELK